MPAFHSSLATQLTTYAVALVGASCFAIVFRTPKRYLVQTVFVGFASCIAPRFLPAQWHVGFTTFVVALGIGALSHLFARATAAPAQCFIIPGVIFLVPGTYIYRAFTAALQESTVQAWALALAAISITCGVSFGLLIANWLVPSRKTL